MNKKILCLAALFLFSNKVLAKNSNSPDNFNLKSSFPLGIGLEYQYSFSDNFGVTAGAYGTKIVIPPKFTKFVFNKINISKVKDIGNINLGVDFRGVKLVADYYPWSGIFRLNGGVIIGNKKLYVNEDDNNELLNLINNSSSNINVKSVNAEFSSKNKVSPYLGLGWDTDRNDSGLYFSTDIGVIYLGELKPNIKVTCNTKCSDKVNNQVEDYKKDLLSKWNNFKYKKYTKFAPVISIGLGYRF